MRHSRLLSQSATALAILALTACDGMPSPADPTAELEPGAAFGRHTTAGSIMSSDVLRDVAALRAATASAHNLDHAAASSPEGAMGVHMAARNLFDEVVEVTRPETLVYEPMKNGRMRLVAVEYIVPFDAHPADAEPPTAFGRDFHANEAVGIWALHVSNGPGVQRA